MSNSSLDLGWITIAGLAWLAISCVAAFALGWLIKRSKVGTRPAKPEAAPGTQDDELVEDVVGVSSTRLKPIKLSDIEQKRRVS